MRKELIGIRLTGLYTAQDEVRHRFVQNFKPNNHAMPPKIVHLNYILFYAHFSTFSLNTSAITEWLIKFYFSKPTQF